MRPVLFDDRSATTARISGWERYAKELLQRLTSVGAVEPAGLSADHVLGRLFADVVSMPLAARSHRAVHFPTFPPVIDAVRSERVFYTLHDLTWWLYPETASRGGRWYYRRLAERAVQQDRVHVIVGSEAVAHEVQQHFGIGRDRLSVAPLGVTGVAPAAPSPRSRPFLLFVGTEEPRKNLSRLASAFTASGLSRNYDLLVVGRAGWGGGVPGLHVLRGVSDPELAALYQQATLLVLPSLYEGFGLPVIEALAAGTPVACSDLPVLREVTGGHATFFDPMSVDSMSSGLVSAIDRGRHHALSAAEHVSRYTWDATADRVVRVYQDA